MDESRSAWYKNSEHDLGTPQRTNSSYCGRPKRSDVWLASLRRQPHLLLDGALERAGDEGGREDAPQGAGGCPQLVAQGLDERHPGGPQLDNPVDQEGGERLQEHRVLRDDDIPQARPPGLLGSACRLVDYPLEAAESL